MKKRKLSALVAALCTALTCSALPHTLTSAEEIDITAPAEMIEDAETAETAEDAEVTENIDSNEAVDAVEQTEIGDTYQGILQYQKYSDHVAITGYLDQPVEVIIPSEIDSLPVTEIASSAFFTCKTLKSITLPASVTSIGSYAFYFCSALQSITIENPNCSISASLGTISNSEDNSYNFVYYGTIYGYADSTAQKYAEKNGYTFAVIGERVDLEGDINGDGALSVADAVLLFRVVAEDETLRMTLDFNEQIWEKADMDKDGLITVRDCAVLMGKF